MKQRGVCVMISLVLLWMALAILYAVHENKIEPDAGCKTQFGKVVDC